MPRYECWLIHEDEFGDYVKTLEDDHDVLVFASTPYIAAQIAAKEIDWDDDISYRSMEVARSILVVDDESRECWFFWVHSKVEYSPSQQELDGWMIKEANRMKEDESS